MQRLVLSVRLREQKAGLRSRNGPRGPAAQLQLPRLPQLPASHILLLVFSGNFIGIVCARTLHYQFYSWWAPALISALMLWLQRLGCLTPVLPAVWCSVVNFHV